MIRLVKSVCLVLFLIATAALPAISQESKTVTAEGVAAIQGNARDIARDAALEDAQKRAVEQAIGILIDSQTQVENYQLISDKILSQTKGYIKRYNITSETVDSGLLRVRINAEVALGQLTDDLAGIGILLGRMHMPRTMVMIAEQNIGHEWYAWWWGHQGSPDGHRRRGKYVHGCLYPKGFCVHRPLGRRKGDHGHRRIQGPGPDRCPGQDARQSGRCGSRDHGQGALPSYTAKSAAA